MKKDNTSGSVIWHHIKTGLYALSAIVLAGWITDALNEDLMFRIMTRYFFPAEVENYQHPFSDFTSFLIWGIPLLIGLLLMLTATVMTIHHVKKKHVYVIKKPKKLSHYDNVIIGTEPEQLPAALDAYGMVDHIHILSFRKNSAEYIEKLIANIKTKKNSFLTVTVHELPETDDLHSFTSNLIKILHGIYKQEKKEMAFDVKFATSLASCAAMYCSLETDLSLVWMSENTLFEYETEYAVET